MAHRTIADNTTKAIAKLKALKLASLRASNADASPFLGTLPPEI